MMTGKQLTRREGERGNALFLILIAVALFAALSYAITQSGRGSGTVNKETNIVVAGQVVEEPAAVRTAITRMIITGTTPSNIVFSGASANNVFDTATGGGGATDVAPPSAACGTAADCASWLYVPASATSTGIFVQGIGSAVTAPTAGEGFAVLGSAGGGLTSAICTQINKGLGIAAPVTQATAVVWGTPGAFTAAAGGNAATVAGAAAELNKVAFACFKNGTAGNYTYYHVLIEQ